MDKPLPDDFDPTQLVDDQMQEPPQNGNECNQSRSTQKDDANEPEILLPMLHILPAPLKKLLFTGSCCVGVAVLYVLSAWDHQWIPGVKSSLAAADEVQALKSDVTEMYVLSLARAIRDLSADNCTLRSKVVDEQIVELRRKYKARTGDEYPHIECPSHDRDVRSH